MKQNLLAIGEFSRLSRLSVKALRLYDDKGLLMPVEVDPSNGYRYYHPDQLQRAELIALLRSADMPLVEIQKVLTSDEEGRLTVVARHRMRMDDRFETTKRTIDYIARTIAKGVEMTYEIEIRDLPAKKMLATRFSTTPDRIGIDLTDAYRRLFSHLAETSTVQGDAVAIYHDCDTDEWDVEGGILGVEDVREKGSLKVREFPTCQVAVALHKGPYEGLGRAYQALESYVETNGYKTAGSPFDLYLNDPSEVDTAELLTEAMWPIE